MQGTRTVMQANTLGCWRLLKHISYLRPRGSNTCCYRTFKSATNSGDLGDLFIDLKLHYLFSMSMMRGMRDCDGRSASMRIENFEALPA